METLLEVRDIHTFIGQYHILQGVSLSVRKGSITGTAWDETELERPRH